MEDRILGKLVQSMNRHLPVRRKSLDELLKEEKPSVTGRDGVKYAISREELRLLSKKVPVYEWTGLKLPIIIEMTSAFETTSARVRGRIECGIIRGILGTKKGNDIIVLYLPEVRELRRNLPTATQYGFFITP